MRGPTDGRKRKTIKVKVKKTGIESTRTATFRGAKLGWAAKIGGGKQRPRWVSILSEELGYEYNGDVESDSEEE